MPKTFHEPISTSLIEEACARLADSKRVRQPLPGGGSLNIDRLLPFLCIYRRNPARRDEGTETFVAAEASYLLAPGDAPIRGGLKKLVQRIAQTSAERLGSFLILEVWAGDDRDVPRDVDGATGEPLLPRPAFRILTRRPHRPEGTVATLEFALQRIKLHGQAAQVEINQHARNHPAGMTQLVSEADERQLGCYVLGLEVRPIYRDPKTGEVYDRVLRSLSRGVARSLKKAFFAFALHRTTVRPQHYFSLGRRSLPQQVLTIDRQLAEVSGQFKFLLLVTPVNAERSWREFAESGYAKQPVLQYRPLDTDPLLLKRRLMKVPTERVDDPTLAHVLRQTQDELDRQITMLGDIGTRRFLPGSLQVFGGVEPALLKLAGEILTRLPDGKTDVADAPLDAKAFARRANREIKHYQTQAPSFAAKAIVRDDMYSGLLSTGGNLLIGRETSIAARRGEALLQHEVGTHLVTYYNGAAQPLRLLRVGLAGYDGLQEGLAVLSEYLVGGLSGARMRTLAARVVATDSMIRGEPFASTFSQLVEQHGFEQRSAYTIVLRVYRGGGLTKDAVYLRGLVEILEYIGKGGDLSPLFVGKLAADHIPVVRELLLRGVLREPLLRPRYMEDAACVGRLERLDSHSTVLDLLAGQSKKED
ncbi:MAG: flavohemoglobin expression-modulating QEGLA motif protein [Planctomycetota bacterium]|nr:flavohemoglobin expression-modulating QEGLA motif protein [Planctomycetota bacterium]